MEGKGLRVNLGKTKVMKCCDGAGLRERSGKFPCGVCGKGVGVNSIKCTLCMTWTHEKCSDVTGRLQDVVDFHCRKCLDCALVSIVLTYYFTFEIILVGV